MSLAPTPEKTIEHIPTLDEWVGAGYKAAHYDSRFANSVEPTQVVIPERKPGAPTMDSAGQWWLNGTKVPKPQ